MTCEYTQCKTTFFPIEIFCIITSLGLTVTLEFPHAVTASICKESFKA